MNRTRSNTVRSVDELLADLPRQRTTGDLIDETERKWLYARVRLYVTLVLAGVLIGIWISAFITRP